MVGETAFGAAVNRLSVRYRLGNGAASVPGRGRWTVTLSVRDMLIVPALVAQLDRAKDF